MGPIVVSGSTVYVGGSFVSIGGLAAPPYRRTRRRDRPGDRVESGPEPERRCERPRPLRVDRLRRWAASARSVEHLRNDVAALDAATGHATPWNPNWDNTVYTLAASGSTVYAGGDFTSIGGLPRNRIAALTRRRAATAWNPSADDTVNVLDGRRARPSTPAASSRRSTHRATGSPRSTHDRSGDRLEPDADAVCSRWPSPARSSTRAAGSRSIGGQPRRRIAALDATTGAATAWNPSANNTVHTAPRLRLDGLRRRPLHDDRRANPQLHRGAGRYDRPGDPLEPACDWRHGSKRRLAGDLRIARLRGRWFRLDRRRGAGGDRGARRCNRPGDGLEPGAQTIPEGPLRSPLRAPPSMPGQL